MKIFIWFILATLVYAPITEALFGAANQAVWESNSPDWAKQTISTTLNVAPTVSDVKELHTLSKSVK